MKVSYFSFSEGRRKSISESHVCNKKSKKMKVLFVFYEKRWKMLRVQD